MPHPLVGDLTKMTSDELTKNMSSLQKKMYGALRLGYPDAVEQLKMFIADYQAEIDARHNKALDEAMKSSDTPDLDSFIDIG